MTVALLAAAWLAPITVMAIETLLTAAMVLVFLSVGRRSWPWQTLWAGARRIVLEKEFRVPALWTAGIFFANAIETRFDDALAAALGHDATGWIHRLEGDLGAAFQGVSWLPATYVLSFVYIILFPVVMIIPFLLPAAAGNLAAYRAALRAIAFNYLACLPFYLLFPVKEMWAGNPGKVRLLLDEVHPAIMAAYRSTSALDNCFPSFHVSMAATMALLAWRFNSRRFAILQSLTALAIALSTIYLGIHWLLDVAAGILLALIAAMLAKRDKIMAIR